MRPAHTFMIAGAACFGLIACAAANTSDGGAAEPSLHQPVVVEITNQNFYDATLWAVTGSRRERLGFVPGYGRATFSFAWVAPQVRLEIALQGVGSYRTEAITVSAGETLQYAIPPDAHRRARP